MLNPINVFTKLLPYLLLYLILQIISLIRKKKHLDEDFQLLVEMAFFVFGWAVHLASPSAITHPTDVAFYLVYVVLLFASSSFLQSSAKSNSFLLILTICGVEGALIAYFGYPIFKQNWSWDVIFVFPLLLETRGSFFYVLIPLLSITSGLFCYMWITYSDLIRAKLSRGSSSQKSEADLKSALVYFQIIPLTLLPLVIGQAFWGTAPLEPIVTTLYVICGTQVYYYVFCPAMAFGGDAILKRPFLAITSIFSLVSFVFSLYVAFQFIVLNVSVGTYAIAVVLSSLFAAALGMSLAKLS